MKHLFILLALIGLVSCASGEVTEETTPAQNVSELNEIPVATEDELFAEITDLHHALIDTSSKEVSKDNAIKLLDKSMVFLTRFEDSESRLNVLQYGEAAARGMGNLPESAKLLEKLLKEFPVIEERPKYMSLLAHTYLEMDKKPDAQRWYGNLVQEHPDSEWAADAQGNLDMLNMTDEELMEFLKEKNNL